LLTLGKSGSTWLSIQGFGVLFAAFAFVGGARIGLARDNDDPPVAKDALSRLASEAPKSWSEAERFYRHLEGAAKSTTTEYRQGGEESASRLFAFFVNDDRVALEVTGLKRGNHEVYCLNESRAFVLWRGKSETDFAIRNVARIGDSASQTYNNMIRLHLLEYLCLPYGIVQVRFGEVVNSPDWQLKLVSSESKPSEVVVMCTPVGELAKKSPFSAIKIKTVPDRKWAIVESELVLPRGRVVYSIEYEEPGSAVPALKRVRKQTSDLNGGMLESVDFLVEKLEGKSIPPDRFTLAAYGLPDVPGPGESSPGRFWLILINLGIILIIISVVMRRRWRRHDRPRSIPTG
jgi:hypothetical protein